MDSISIAVHGATGRMGQAVLRAAVECDDVRIAAALVRADSPAIGQAAVGCASQPLAFSAALGPNVPDVLIDFSLPAAFDEALALACDRGMAFVSGTTGLGEVRMAALETAARTIPVLWSANFSLGVAVLAHCVAEAASRLPGWDCEIVEAHHRHKKDAPSGTALALGRVVAEARGVAFDAVARRAREGADAPRRAGEIGFAALRGGDIVGEHMVVFAGDGERIELAHRATDRAIFARGALVAARWLARRAPGRYTMADVVAGN